VVGFFTAAVAVTLMQLWRTRDRRLLALLALFGCLAQAHGRDWRDPWRDRFHYGAGASGLALLFVLSRERTHPAR
jgi:hypothetical protein